MLGAFIGPDWSLDMGRPSCARERVILKLDKRSIVKRKLLHFKLPRRFRLLNNFGPLNMGAIDCPTSNRSKLTIEIKRPNLSHKRVRGLNERWSKNHHGHRQSRRDRGIEEQDDHGSAPTATASRSHRKWRRSQPPPDHGRWPREQPPTSHRELSGIVRTAQVHLAAEEEEGSRSIVCLLHQRHDPWSRPVRPHRRTMSRPSSSNCRHAILRASRFSPVCYH